MNTHLTTPSGDLGAFAPPRATEEPAPSLSAEQAERISAALFRDLLTLGPDQVVEAVADISAFRRLVGLAGDAEVG